MSDNPERPVSYAVVETRTDGVEHYVVRMESGEVKQIWSHVSNHLPYYHFGHEDQLKLPPPYDADLLSLAVAG